MKRTHLGNEVQSGVRFNSIIDQRDVEDPLVELEPRALVGASPNHPIAIALNSLQQLLDVAEAVGVIVDQQLIQFLMSSAAADNKG